MRQEKAFLRQKFIEFQLKIAELDRACKKQEEVSVAKDREYFLNLFEVLDALESIEESIRAKEKMEMGENATTVEAGLNKTARLLAKNLRSIHKKLVRMLTANHITAIEFPGNKARMDLCIVVDTRADPDLKNEAILSVVKKGYRHEKLGVVIRKAEVITVLNSGP